MNRTLAFLLLAAALGLVALVVKIPGPGAAPNPTPPTPQPVAVPVSNPIPVVTPAPITSTPGSLTLAAKLSSPYVLPGSSDVYLTADVTGVDVPGATRAPVNLAVVIDRSGSMSAQKIAHARLAALALLDQLNANDRVSIVHFGTDVSVLPAAYVTEENRSRMRRFISGIQEDGGTNIGDALAAGKRQLDGAHGEFKVNRLVLVSDGQPTVGLVSFPALARLADRFHTEGVTLTAIGVGLDFNEDLMTRLAAVGGGSSGYLRDTTQLADLFSRDLKQAGTLVARDVKLSLTLPAGVRFVEALGREAQVSGNTVTVAMPDFSSGQVERLVLRVAATAPGNGTFEIAKTQLTYQDVLAAHPADAAITLSAMVAHDNTLAEQRRDKDVAVAVVRAHSAINYKKAADFIANNQPAQAQEALRENEAMFDDLSAHGQGDAVKDDRAQNKGYFGLTSPSAPRDSQLNAVKQMKVQSLKSSGWGASAY